MPSEEIKKTFVVHTRNLSSTECSVLALLHLSTAEMKQREGCVSSSNIRDNLYGQVHPSGVLWFDDNHQTLFSWLVPRHLVLDCRTSAIGSDNGASDITRTRRDEKADDLGNFLNVCRTVEWGRAPKCFDTLWCRAAGVDRARSNGVDSHTAGTELCSPGTSHRRESSLRRSVGCATREPNLASHAAEVDDAAFAPDHHCRRKCGNEEVCSADVAGEQGIKRVDVEFLSCTKPGEAGVVDQDVNVANLFDQVLKVSRVAKISCDEACLPARCGDRFDCLVAACSVAAVNDDFGSVASQLEGDCAANAGCCTGHERFLALKTMVLSARHLLLPSCRESDTPLSCLLISNGLALLQSILVVCLQICYHRRREERW